MAISIGELTGEISLEDRFSSALDLLVEGAKGALTELEGSFGVIGVAAVAAAGAIVGITGSIVALGVEGSHINDLDAGFNRLAGSAENADKIMQAMLEGTKHTLDDDTLKQFADKGLASGAIKTAEAFGTVTAASRVLSREGFGPLPSLMNEIERAMATGRVRFLEQKIGVIDLKTAEEAYAKTLGTTASQLSRTGKLHADQIAILARLNAEVAKAGDLQVSFAERMDQVNVKIKEWFMGVAGAVANLPSLGAALDAIGIALERNFGTAGETAKDTIVRLIDKFAQLVTDWAPRVIDGIGKVVDVIKNLYDGVVSAVSYVEAKWNSIPDWFKTIGSDASKALGVIILVKEALEASVGLAAVSGFFEVAGDAAKTGIFTTLASGIKDFVVTAMMVYKLDGLGGILTAIGIGFDALLASPLLLYGLLAALGAAFIQVGNAVKAFGEAWRANQSIWDLFNREDDNWVRRWLGLATAIDKTREALDKLPKRTTDIELFPFTGPKSGGPPAGAPPSEIKTGGGKEAADATKAMLEKAADYWGQYDRAVIKAVGNTFDIAEADANAWLDKELRSLDKSKADVASKYKAQEAIIALYFQKITDAQMAWDEAQIETSRHATESNAQWIGGNKQLNATLLTLSQSTAVWSEEWVQLGDGSWEVLHGLISGSQLVGTALKGLPPVMKDIDTQSAETERAISRAMNQAAKDAVPFSTEQKGQIQRMKDLGMSAQEMAANMGVSLKRITGELLLLGGAAGLIGNAIKNAIPNIMSTLQNAFQGGGNLVGAIKSIVTQIAGGIIQPVLDHILVATQNMKLIAAGTAGVAAGVGTLASGGSVPSAIGNTAMAGAGIAASMIAAHVAVGTAIAFGAATFGIGLAAIAAYYALKKMFSVDPDIKKAQASADSFIKSLQDSITLTQKIEAGTSTTNNLAAWKDSVIVLRDKYLALGLTEEQAVSDMGTLFRAETMGSASTAAQLDLINKKLQIGQKIMEDRAQLADMTNQLFGILSSNLSAITAPLQTQVDAWDAIQKNIDSAKTNGTDFTQLLIDQKGTITANKQELDDLGTIAVASFDAAIASGKSFYEALAIAGPSLSTIFDAFTKLGIPIDNDALKFLGFQSTLLKNNPQLVQGVDALGSSFAILAQYGTLNETSFLAMEHTGETMYSRLQSAVAAMGGSTKDALVPMQGYLHDAKDAADKLHIPLDDATQSMIDQSIEAGIWKDKVKSPTDILIEAMDKLNKELDLLIAALDRLSGKNITYTVNRHNTTDGDDGSGKPGGPGGATVPEAAGGIGFASGPMTFTTKGNEEYAFSGEGRSFADLLAGRQQPSVTIHNNFDVTGVLDGDGLVALVETHVGPILARQIEDNVGGLHTRMVASLER